MIFLQQAGHNRHEEICESLELFAAEVLPEFAAAARSATRRSKRAELAPLIEAALARKPRMPPLADDEIPVVQRVGGGADRQSLGRAKLLLSRTRCAIVVWPHGPAGASRSPPCALLQLRYPRCVAGRPRARRRCAAGASEIDRKPFGFVTVRVDEFDPGSHVRIERKEEETADGRVRRNRTVLQASPAGASRQRDPGGRTGRCR